MKIIMVHLLFACNQQFNTMKLIELSTSLRHQLSLDSLIDEERMMYEELYDSELIITDPENYIVNFENHHGPKNIARDDLSGF